MSKPISDSREANVSAEAFTAWAEGIRKMLLEAGEKTAAARVDNYSFETFDAGWQAAITHKNEGAVPFDEYLAHQLKDPQVKGAYLAAKERLAEKDECRNEPAAPVAVPVDASADVPAGWRLIPWEPTDEMVEAAQKVWFAPNQCADPTMHVWDAMLAAAPAAPVAVPVDASQTLFAAIKHGDAAHQAWLKEAIEAHFAGRPVPPPVLSGAPAPHSGEAASHKWDEEGDHCTVCGDLAWAESKGCTPKQAPIGEDGGVVADRDAGSVMLSAYNLCPNHVLGQPARMRWIADYFLKHYAAQPQAAPSVDSDAAIRLRDLCSDLGVPACSVPQGDAELLACLFSLLGSIRFRVRELKAAPSGLSDAEILSISIKHIPVDMGTDAQVLNFARAVIAAARATGRGA